jgi:hypothetical protein
MGRVNFPPVLVGSGNCSAIGLRPFVTRSIGNVPFVKTIGGMQEDETDVKDRQTKSGDPQITSHGPVMCREPKFAENSSASQRDSDSHTSSENEVRNLKCLGWL